VREKYIYSFWFLLWLLNITILIGVAFSIIFNVAVQKYSLSQHNILI